jgi:hypothetical protein
MSDYVRKQVTGRGIPVPGNDIDTDRIIPARFLKEVTFESMGEHAFEDARKQNPEHPFNSPVYTSAAAPRASTRRRRSCAGASARSWAAPTARSSSATA